MLGALAVVLVAAGIAWGVTSLAGSLSSTGAPSGDDGSLAANDSAAPATPVVELEPGRIIMNLNGSEDTYVLKGESYIESGCHVLDKEEGDLTDRVQTSGEADANTVGDYTVSYTVTNDAGMTFSRERRVHVVDDMDVDDDGISVLMYHYVYTADDPPDEVNSNYLLDTALDEQLQWLTDEGYYYPSFQELRAYIDGTHSLPRKSVVLTFDDGQKGFLKYGIPLLEKHKVPATSFIIASQKTAPDKVHDYASEYVSFQSHSYNLHRDGVSGIGRGGVIYDLSQEEIADDLRKAIEVVQNGEAFAYPYGDVCDTAQAALADVGVLCAFTIEYDQVRQGADPTALPRVRVLGESALEGFAYSVENGL